MYSSGKDNGGAWQSKWCGLDIRHAYSTTIKLSIE